MTRVVACGAAFAEAVEVLGLEPVDERPDLVLVDLEDVDAVALAAGIASDVPRVVIAGDRQERSLRAAGCTLAVASSAHPAVLGPLIAAAIPARPRRATRLVVVTGPRGGSGRTLLAAALAERLAARVAVLVVDATGSGAVGWWLRLTAGPWSDLEGLVEELSAEHLAIIAAERGRLRTIGGASSMPTIGLLMATARAATGIADLVLVDAPPVFDERTRALMAAADRVLLIVADDPASLAALEEPPDERVWLIASRCRAALLCGRPVLRSLPDDPASVRAAARGPSTVGGPLGRAYDDLAELVALDIT